MKRTILISVLAMVTASSMLVTGCDEPGEVISVKNVKGAGKVSADDGTGAVPPKDLPSDKVPGEVDVAKGPAKARAYVGSAYSVNGSAHAEKAGAAPPASKAAAMSTVTATSEFTLEKDGRKVPLKVNDHFTVTLNGDDARATIHIEAKISKAGSAVATIDKTCEFKPNAADPVKSIDVSGAHTETIANGVGKAYEEKITPTPQTLNKGDYTMELKLTITTSGSVLAEAVVDDVKMSVSN